MKDEMADKFLLLCKLNYNNGITPANNKNRSEKNYEELVKLANEYFERKMYKEFTSFFREGQYFIELWTAHLLLEFGNPTKELVSQAPDIIVKYSDSPLLPDVAKEEKEWINRNLRKY